jgi:hypothetical protein
VLPVGSLIEAVAGVIHRDRTRLGGGGILDLHTHRTLENVADDRAGVAVGLGRFAGTVVDLNDLEVEVVAFERGKALREDGAGTRGRLLLRGRSLLRMGYGWQRCVADDGEYVGPAFDEAHV